MFKIVFTDNPSVIEWQVNEALGKGLDLGGNPFVLAGNFCQPMAARWSRHDYKLVSAFLPGQFEDDVRALLALGFELAFEGVDWNGMRFQWMAKPKPADGLQIEQIHYAGTLPGFKVVAGVQVLGGLSSVNFLPGVIR